jgi:hypothetical protein
MCFVERLARMVSFDEFCDFIKRITRSKARITTETDIVHDLGVAGIDGQNLASALHEAYGVEMTRDEILQHFGEERAMTPWHLVLWLLGKAPPLKPLLVGELYDRVASCR